jgi:hypothetical protein
MSWCCQLLWWQVVVAVCKKVVLLWKERGKEGGSSTKAFLKDRHRPLNFSNPARLIAVALQFKLSQQAMAIGLGCQANCGQL